LDRAAEQHVDPRIVLLRDHPRQRLARGEAEEVDLDAAGLLELLEHRPGIVLRPDRVDVERVGRLSRRHSGQPGGQAGKSCANELHRFPPMWLSCCLRRYWLT